MLDTKAGWRVKRFLSGHEVEPFVPLVCASLVLGIGIWLYHALMLCKELDVPNLLIRRCNTLEPLTFDFAFSHFQGKELAARLRWAGTTIMSVAVSLAAGAVLVFLIYRSLGCTRRLGLTLALGVACAAVVFAVFASSNNTDLLFLVVRVLEPSVGTFVHVRWVAGVMIGLPLAVGVLVATAMHSCLVSRNRVTRLPDVRVHIDRLQLTLYIGAAVLIVAILNAGSLFRWPIAFVQSGDAHKPFAEMLEAIASAYTTTYGSFYSLLLAALFIPAAAILRHRAISVARREGATSPAHVERVLEGERIGLSWSRRTANLLAILGPLIASNPLGGVEHLFGV